MTVLSLSTSSADQLTADAVVVGIAQSDNGPLLTAGTQTAAVGTAFDGTLTSLLETLGAKGNENEITKLQAPDSLGAPLVMTVGLGTAPEEGEPVNPETLRRAAGAAARALTGRRHAVFALPTEDESSLAAVCEGALLGAYSFDAFRGDTTDDGDTDRKGRKAGKTGGKDGARDEQSPHAPLAQVTVAGVAEPLQEHQTIADRAGVLAEEVLRARDLVATPPNALDPEEFASRARAAAREHGLKIEVLDEKALASAGYGGLIGVGQGSQSPPRLVRLSYTHPKAKRSLALVGKGITYDSGGISLKPAGSNETMKSDMAGAAAVFAAVLGAARLGLAVNVTGWLALAENMPSGSATRPGDVLSMYSGKTVEVLNTDAEGRLVLADALTRACEESPDALVDVATLTGSMVVALGRRTFGVMGNDEAFRELVHHTAEDAGEQSWPLPLPGELLENLKSEVADIANAGDRMGGGLAAGLFLNEFVADGTTWAHLDIAGPAFNEGQAFGYTPKGGTGTSVRTLVLLAERIADGELDG